MYVHASGPDAVPVKLRINGHEHAVSVEPRYTLAQTLRDELGLTGTKVVCDRGSCSACTVWLDKTPSLACMTLAIDAVGREITTIEGLSQGDTMHPVQAAFVKHDAMQCGFCTPGMVMSCAALLERNANPQLADVKHAISGNLCRCGTYPKIFAATLDVAHERRQAAGLGDARTQERRHRWKTRCFFSISSRNSSAGEVARAKGCRAKRSPRATPKRRTPRHHPQRPQVPTRTESLVFGIPQLGLEHKERQVPLDEPPPLAANADLTYIGKPTIRYDGPAKAMGKGKYTADVHLPGMLYRADGRCLEFRTARSSLWTPARPKSCPECAPSM